MSGWDGEKNPQSDDREKEQYESMSAEEVDARLKDLGIDPTRTIAGVAKLVREKRKDWAK